MNQRLLAAMLALSIWNPALWDFFPNMRRKKQLQLYYQTMGIVMHDRELNRETP